MKVSIRNNLKENQEVLELATKESLGLQCHGLLKQQTSLGHLCPKNLKIPFLKHQ